MENLKKLSRLIEIIYVMWLREVKKFIYFKQRILGALGLPLFFLLILGSSISPTVRVSGFENYIEYIIPGIVSMAVLFPSSQAGSIIILDKNFGFLKETLVAPVSRIEIMLGRTFGGATTGLLHGIFILILSLLLLFFFFSKFPNVIGILIMFVFMFLTGICFTAFATAIATQTKDIHYYLIITNFVIFPIFGFSGAMIELSSLPSWMQPIAIINPFTYCVEGVRFGLFGVSPINPLISFFVLSAYTIVFLIIGAKLFEKIKI